MRKNQGILQIPLFKLSSLTQKLGSFFGSCIESENVKEFFQSG